MSSIKKLTQKRLFLPIFSMILVMLINVVYDIATGSAPLSFFMISIKNDVLYGRLIDILNRGSEIAILAIGMTLVVSASGGTDISVGSVMSLYAGVCCMILAGYGNVNVQQYAHPLLVGIGAGLLVTLICGMFNGFLVAYMNIQPMVATLILWSAGRAVGLLLCNSQIVYVRVPSFQKLGGYCGIIPTPIIVAAVCVAIAVVMFAQISNINTPMIGSSDTFVWNADIPNLILAAKIWKPFSAIFAIIVFAGIYTTAVPLLYNPASRFAKEGTSQFKILTIVLGVLGLIVGLFLPFRVLVNIIYVLNGYVGAVLILFMIYKNIKDLMNKKKAN